MNHVELTKKNAQFINEGSQAIAHAMNAVSRVYETFPKPVQNKYHNLYDCIMRGLEEARNDYVALGSCLLSNITHQMLLDKKEEEK